VVSPLKSTALGFPSSISHEADKRTDVHTRRRRKAPDSVVAVLPQRSAAQTEYRVAVPAGELLDDLPKVVDIALARLPHEISSVLDEGADDIVIVDRRCGGELRRRTSLNELSEAADMVRVPMRRAY
jgi:flagellar motor switch/type III secretory pathway protein FliN